MRGSRGVELRYPAICADCGADLAPGDKARIYMNGAVYGVGCHEYRPGQRAKVTNGRYQVGQSVQFAGKPHIIADVDGQSVQFENDPAWYAKVKPYPRARRSEWRTGYSATGKRCIDAPCCGCC